MNASPPRTSTARAAFVDGGGHRLFGLHIVPTGPVRAAALYVPPFAEEMNRCRSHAAAQARALAAQGVHCLLIDLFGTGESDGAFEQAGWDSWHADVAAAALHLQAQSGHAPVLWGARTGALLAARVASQGATPVAGLLLWQPVLDGATFLNQTLRLRIASQMVNEAERETTEQIRARLQQGETLEVAGYPLTAGLAEGLAASRLADFAPAPGTRVGWLEMVARPEQPMAVPSRRLLEQWRAGGVRVVDTTVACPLIWQLHERADAPELDAATLKLWEDLQ